MELSIWLCRKKRVLETLLNHWRPIVLSCGFIGIKYAPFSKLISDSCFLQMATTYKAEKDMEHLRMLGYYVPHNENAVYRITDPKPQSVIDQTISDINKTREEPIDISKLKIGSSLTVHIGNEYHSGSLMHEGFIVLPGTFGMTGKHKSIFKAANVFSHAAIQFSLLDEKTWKFMMAKELLYLEEEKKMMKFSMVLGSFIILATWRLVTIIVKNTIQLPKQSLLREMDHNIIVADPNRYSAALAKKMGRYERKVVFGFYVIAYGVYKAIMFQRWCSQTRELDRTLAELGPDYVQGGRDYFERALHAGFFQNTMLNDKNFDEIGNKKIGRYLFIVPRVVTREERYEFFSKLCDEQLFV